MTPIDQKVSVYEEIAAALGYWIVTREGPVHWRNSSGHRCQLDEIVEPSLDRLATIWEEELKGWHWQRGARGREHYRYWYAHHDNVRIPTIEVPDTSNFLNDFAALTLACLRAKKGKG